jgi:periplasmic divalent cation tolerance protein
MPPVNPAALNPAGAYAIVLTTTATEAQADALARQIVQARLGACVQIQPLKSIYRWKGALCAEREWQLAIKTRQDRCEAVAQFIAAHHAYETPEIVQIPLTAGSPAYLRWLDDETQTPD